jgi:hypothetical protein
VEVLPVDLTMGWSGSGTGETEIALSWKATQNLSGAFLFLKMENFSHPGASTSQSVCGSLTTKATDFWKVAPEQFATEQ